MITPAFQIYATAEMIFPTSGQIMNHITPPHRQPSPLTEILLTVGASFLVGLLFPKYVDTKRISKQPSEADAKFKGWVGLLRQTFQEWNDDDVPRLGAALAFYSMLSIGPLLLIIISVAGLVFGHDRSSAFLINELRTLLGADGAGAIEDILRHSQNQAKSLLATAIGIVTLIISATGFFGQLQAALNIIWNVPKEKASIFDFMKKRILSFGMIAGICLLLLFSLVISAGLSAFTGTFSNYTPAIVAQIASVLVSFAVTTLLFAMVFKFLPDVHIQWADVWIGAIMTALLFTVGKSLIGLYIGRSTFSSTYGAAGSMIILLIWIYYSAQIVFFGAEFTQVYSTRKRGRPPPLAPPVHRSS